MIARATEEHICTAANKYVAYPPKNKKFWEELITVYFLLIMYLI
jgi:hypothetical protein